MKIDNVTWSKPKTKKAALSLVLYFQDAIFNWKTKLEKVGKEMDNIKTKMEKLETQLKNLQEQKEKGNLSILKFQEELKVLHDEFQLTEMEIQTERARLLEQKIENLKKEAGITKTGETLKP